MGLFQTYRFYWLAFIVILIDQFVKLIVKFNLQLYDEVPVLGDLFSINFIENKGAAFGLTLADLGNQVGVPISDETAKLILTLFSILAVTVIIYLLKQVKSYRSPLPYFLALILGGAVGNIIDRVFYGVWFAGINNYEGGLLHGRVVDMFYLDAYRGEILGQEINLLPVFNVADAAITIGIIAIILFQRRFFRLHHSLETEKTKAETSTVSGVKTASKSRTESQPEESAGQSSPSLG
ncbi:MAG TPA: lipoprotein signal peptidase [Bacteroidetes bacterium]|nr:lipoprotein signal peptidase [Bacteroidota bacterium]